MKHGIAAAFGVAAVCTTSPFGAAAVEIHKCVGRSSTAYQTAPCDVEQREIAVLSIASRREASTALPGETGRGNGPVEITVLGDRQWLPFSRRRVAAGMGDDEVLNAPDGGLPSRISRTRDGRTWREVWFYERGEGPARALQFVNGRLTSIIEADAAHRSLRLASLGP